MKRNIRRILELIPGVISFKEGGISVIFTVFFYICFITVLSRLDRILSLVSVPSPGERLEIAGAAFAMFLLYLGGTIVPYLKSKYGMGRSRFAKRFSTNKAAVAGLILILFFLLTAIFGPIIAPFDPSEQQGTASARFQAPSGTHLMGTDKFGRDICSRVIYGARVSMSIGIIAVLAASLLGIGIGSIGGYMGGVADDVLMRAADGILAFPRLLIVLLLVAFFANTFALLIVILTCTSWMGMARLIRAEVLSLKDKEYIQAAVASGFSRARIVCRHLLPNALGPAIVAATLQIGSVILLESTLSFLGVGVQPPTPSWGSMVFQGREALGYAWWVSAFPGLAIALAVIACNFLGDGLRDALEPREARG